MRIKELYASPNLGWKLCLVVGIGLLIVCPRILSLEYDWQSDERTWLIRSRHFILSVQNGDLNETVVAPHPGVTTMWLGGASLWMRYKSALAAAPNLITKPFFSPETLATSRIGVTLTTIAALFIAWYFLLRLLGWWRASLAIIFISVDPFYLALSRQLHTDALATNFTLLSVLSLLVYLEVSQRPFYIIFSGICFGLACLSKSTALLLVLYLPLVLGFYNIFNAKKGKNKGNFSTLHLCLTWMGAAFLTFIGLWPGLWTLFGGQFLLPFFAFVLLTLGITSWNYWHIRISAGERISQPKHLIMSLLTITILGAGVLKVAKPIAFGINWGATTPHEVAYLFLGKIVNDPGLLFYPVILSLRSSLFTLPLFLLGFVWFICYREPSESFKVRRIFFELSILIPFFIIPLSFAAKKISRYALPVFPVIDILAAIGFCILLKEFTHLKIYRSIKETVLQVKKRPLSSFAGLFIFILVMFFQIVPVLAVHPYYAAYYNPLWRLTNAAKLFSIGGGVGSDQAGLYLSRKPHAEQLIIRASPVASEFVEYYFPGKVIRDNEDSLYPDYEVVHLYDVQLKRDNHDINRQLEHVVRINGIDFVWIYR